jgi:hypothetical protein
MRYPVEDEIWGVFMGWYGTDGYTKADTIKELRTPANGNVLLASCVKGNVVWSVWELTRADCERVISCDLIEKQCGTWMYKPMDESMGPFYYSCPMAYLRMCPVVNEKWREGVREWHAAAKVTRDRREMRKLATAAHEVRSWLMS